MNNETFVQQIYPQLNQNKHPLIDAETAFSALDQGNLTYQEADNYFHRFGVGHTIPATLSYERFMCYECLIDRLRKLDFSKFQKMHKGTPYYFLAWTAFDIEDYEKALFYSDAAIAEDIRIKDRGWKNTPIGMWFTLKSGGSAARVEQRFINETNEVLESFRKDFSLSFSNKEFIDKFVVPIMEDKSHRSIVTCLYGFILEYRSRKKMLELRSSEGGSIEPFLTHLFKGGLVFESILKLRYPLLKTLNGLNGNPDFKKDFSVTIDTTAQTLSEIVRDSANNDEQAAFNTTVKLRNTTGHNLVWDDIFNDQLNYERLFKQEINAIFSIIYRLYIKGQG